MSLIKWCYPNITDDVQKLEFNFNELINCITWRVKKMEASERCWMKISLSPICPTLQTDDALKRAFVNN